MENIFSEFEEDELNEVDWLYELIEVIGSWRDKGYRYNK